jgi:hypothetical protein
VGVWIKLDTKFMQDEAVRAIGPVNAYVYFCLLAHCKEAGTRGFIPDKVLAPGTLQIVTGNVLTQEQCQDAVAKILKSTLVVRTEGKLKIRSWSRYQADPGNAERQAAYRRRQKGG